MLAERVLDLHQQGGPQGRALVTRLQRLVYQREHRLVLDGKRLVPPTRHHAWGLDRALAQQIAD